MNNTNSGDDAVLSNAYPSIAKPPNIKKRMRQTVLLSAFTAVFALVLVYVYWYTLNDLRTFKYQINLPPAVSDTEESALCETCGNAGTDCGCCLKTEEKEAAKLCAVCNTEDCAGHDDIPHAPDIVLSQEKVRFRPDQAVFLHQAEAEAAISRYAAELKEVIENSSSEVKIYVIGTVADTRYSRSGSYTARGSQILSEERAVAVLDVLIKYGVPESSAAAFGMSHNDPWHIQNYDENGLFDEEIAAVNRKVVIVMSGDDALETLNMQIISMEDTVTLFYYENGVLKSAEVDIL